MNKVFLILFIPLLLTISLSMNAQNKKRLFQLSFVSPIGTNGMESENTINDFSLNILGGYSYGNNILELGGLYNINLEHTTGCQIAGLFNYSGNAHGVFQLAGIANISKDKAEGVQISGITNIAKRVDGVQTSGIINIADEVNGVQIGLINYANRSNGASIGLINIIKENGIHDFSVSFSECLNTEINFRLGSKNFYTIFAVGSSFINKKAEFALGGGFGTQIEWKNEKWSNQIELLAFSMTRNKSLKTDGINLLSQIRIPITRHFTKHFSIFAGPTVNMTISKNEDFPIKPYSLWSRNNNSTFMNGWIGAIAGIRF